ncbi:MAG: EamA family transporter [Anaerolineae bacterium]|nr:EamA family transporter [Anaerolineae bacterium]MDW8173365.1 EamA family transporter [Anaerolineae bacterium]
MSVIPAPQDEAHGAEPSSEEKKGVRVNWIGFLYIAMTVFLTVYGQIVIKWQVDLAGDFPPELSAKALFILRLLLNPWVISSFAAAFLASLFWMAAMTQFELSFAYPFMASSFVLVMLFSIVFMGETFSWYKVIGTLTIFLGLLIVTRAS